MYKDSFQSILDILIQHHTNKVPTLIVILCALKVERFGFHLLLYYQDNVLNYQSYQNILGSAVNLLVSFFMKHPYFLIQA